MRCPDARNRLSSQRDSDFTRSAHTQSPRSDANTCATEQKQTVPSPSRTYPGISTERIMRAVEQQRRITQQLDHLHTQQQQRTACLRKTGLKLTIWLLLLIGLLATGLGVWSVFQPEILARTLARLGDIVAILVMVIEDLRTGLSLVPSNSWLLSVAALAFVVLLGVWLRLMRSPQDA